MGDGSSHNDENRTQIYADASQRRFTQMIFNHKGQPKEIQQSALRAGLLPNSWDAPPTARALARLRAMK